MKYIPYDHRREVNPRALIDVGCQNPRAAAANRQRVAEGYASEYWDWLADKLRSVPFGELPEGVPMGSLPQASGSGRNDFDTD